MLIQKLNISDIVDNLTSTATNKPLSAKQGKSLKDLISSLYTKAQIDSLLIQKLNISDIVDNLTSTDTNKPLSAKQGKTLFDTFANYYAKTQIDSFLSQNQMPCSNRLEDAIKMYRQKELDNLTVEHNGNVFQADEVSQDRLLRAKARLDITSQTATEWKTKSDVFVTLTIDNISEILASANTAQQAIWIKLLS